MDGILSLEAVWLETFFDEGPSSTSCLLSVGFSILEEEGDFVCRICASCCLYRQSKPTTVKTAIPNTHDMITIAISKA
jgi:hypothetical protein